jgi:hypothetical protein
MPIQISPITGTVVKDYENPFVGPVNHQAAVKVVVTGMTNKEVDARGYLKPGVPLLRTGALATLATVPIYGVTMEEVKVAASNSAPDLAAATAKPVAVALVGAINRKVAEDMLERAYTANELAAFELSPIKLIF